MKKNVCVVDALKQFSVPCYNKIKSTLNSKTLDIEIEIQLQFIENIKLYD